MGDNEQATDAAVLIKVSQNVLIAFVCLTLALIYDSMVEYEKKLLMEKHKRIASHDGETLHDDDYHPDDDDHDQDDSMESRSDMNKCMFLWKKFPKFILGYLGLSIIISALIIPMGSGGEMFAERFVKNINQISRWLFTLGFIGIGAKTKFTTLWDAIKDGKYLALYHCGQIFDTVLTFAAAYIVFTYIV